MTDEQNSDGFDVVEAPQHDAGAASETEAPQYGVGPFTIREVSLGGLWLVGFIVSFFSLSTVRFDSVWTSGLMWVLTIGVPTVAIFLLALRRLSPDGIRRVGSLGIDQFASVAFSVSAMIWLQLIWETVGVVAQGGPWLRSWVMWVEFVVMAAAVVLTVFAPFIPPFAEDFRGRREVPAHRNARPVRAVTPRPAPEPRREDAGDGGAAPAAGAHAGDASDTGAYDRGAYATGATATAAHDTGAHDTGAYDTGTQERAEEPVWQIDQTATSPRPQAFWALAPVERDVVDDQGAPLFVVGPTAWALVIEDRGHEFVVRHEDGRVGYLRDIDGVTRG